MAINKTLVVENFIQGKNPCINLETSLNKVNLALSDKYNLSDSQIQQYENQKSSLIKRMDNEKCAEQKQREMTTGLQKLSDELSQIEFKKKEQQQKIYRYGLFGVGGLVLVLVLYRVLKK